MALIGSIAWGAGTWGLWVFGAAVEIMIVAACTYNVKEGEVDTRVKGREGAAGSLM